MARLSTALVLPAALAGAVWSLVLGCADLEFRQGTSASLALARRLAPGDAGYLAQSFLLTGDRRSLNGAVARNPYYPWAWIQLGLAAERDGNLQLAERDLLRAAEMDHRFGPRWALSDFYFRHGPSERFWHWAGESLAVRESDGRPVFRLAWRLEPNGQAILDRGIVSTEPAKRQFLTFLIEEAPVDSAASVLPELPLDQRDLLVAYLGKLLDQGHAGQALSVWNALSRNGRAFDQRGFRKPSVRNWVRLAVSFR